MREVQKKTAVIFGICILFFLMCSIGVKGKGDQKPWELSWKGDGSMPFFQSSAVVEIQLKKGNLPKEIKIFINNQQQEVSWHYKRSTEIYFSKEGIYDFCIEHESGERESQRIYVELNSPTIPKVDTDSYQPGTWTSKSVKLTANGAKAVSGIERYEYKMDGDSWKVMEKGEIKIHQNMEEIISIRAISKAGRIGDMKNILVKVWKSSPNNAEIVYPKAQKNGWYQKIPQILYKTIKSKGPEVTEYFRLVNLQTKESCTMKNSIPKISKDGVYQLLEWSIDEAGNRSKKMQVYDFKIDSQKPKIFVVYKNEFSKKRICRSQKVEVQILDENLNRDQINIKTSGTAKFQWLKEQKIYKIIVNFQKEGMQNLEILAKDYAGNDVKWQENHFEIDRTSPKIQIEGIKNYESYRCNILPVIQIKDKNRDFSKEKIYLNGKLWKVSEIKEDGQYCLEVFVEDTAGNQTRKKKIFSINKKGIEIQFLQKKILGKEINEKNFFPAFRVDSVEPVQVQQFLINGRNIEYVWKKRILKTKKPIKEDGNYILQLVLVDAAGNKAKSPKIDFTYDTKAPDIVTEGLGSDHHCFYGKEIKVRTKKKEDTLVSAMLDGKTLIVGKNQVRIRCKKLGKHVLVLKALDQAGNMSKKHIEFTVTKVLPKVINKDANKEIKKYENKTGIAFFAFCSISAGVLLFRMKKRK